MKMLYHIVGLCPAKKMSGAGFCVHLWPEMKEAVARVNLSQAQINTAIENCCRSWLDGCGFDAIFDPSEDPLDKWKREKAGGERKLSKDARPLYDEHSILISWGEWGPEHITVPGNACGLDLDKGYGAPHDGRVLLPHNVDHIDQAHLLLVVFLFFADTIVLNERMRLKE
jgi:hypothetical protein